MKKKRARPPRGSAAADTESEVRIIAGKYRRRTLRLPTDLRTRPMKNRVREAIFNLIGTELAGKHALDLFAGTGALGVEALSRGAARATFIERHFPTADRLQQNLQELGAESAANVVASDTFFWSRQQPELGEAPWVVFCSPPYEFYISRQAEMLELLARLIAAAPPPSPGPPPPSAPPAPPATAASAAAGGSIIVVEADSRFDFGLLPRAPDWDVRSYPPAVVGILRL